MNREKSLREMSSHELIEDLYGVCTAAYNGYLDLSDLAPYLEGVLEEIKRREEEESVNG